MPALTRYRPTTDLTFAVGPNETETVTAALRQITDPTRVTLLQQQLGLNASTLILEARLTSPKQLPSTVKAGHRTAITWAGRPGIARLEPHQGNLATAWRDRYGDRILLSWETNA